ncbi:MAG TPA: hypothetical protein EYP71_04050 [Dehalococcoidia bacterium]|nr:hypothetical protein [Dehalococcoidia bacterium]
MDSLIYQDRPHYDVWFKVIMAFPLLFIVVGVSFLVDGEPQAAVGMFVTAALMAAIYWAVFPRRYCILDGKIKIALGGPLVFNIPFDSIEKAGRPEGMSIGINFATTFSSKHAIQIVRKGKLDVNITPGNRELFLENLDKALKDWKKI